MSSVKHSGGVEKAVILTEPKENVWFGSAMLFSGLFFGFNFLFLAKMHFFLN